MISLSLQDRYALKVKIEVSIQSLAISTGGDNLNKFIILVGLPNTGKTTYAKQYVFGNKDTIIVSYDILDRQIYNCLRLEKELLNRRNTA